MASTLSYFSTVPPLNSLLSEEIISVLLLSRKLQKAITTTKKRMVCRYIKLYFPLLWIQGRIPTVAGKQSLLRSFTVSKLGKLEGWEVCVFFFPFLLYVHQLFLNKIQFLSMGILFLSIC